MDHTTEQDQLQPEPQHEARPGNARGARLQDLDPEVVAKPQRRRFTAEEKLRILEAADACEHGELGALLRREGVYYSTLSKWRAARDRGTFAALENQKPGPKATEPHPAELRLAELERENQRLRDELTKARVIIDVQKKFPSCWVSALRTKAARSPDASCQATRSTRGRSSRMRGLERTEVLVLRHVPSAAAENQVSAALPPEADAGRRTARARGTQFAEVHGHVRSEERRVGTHA